jgi:hypothetical protein
VPRQIPVEMEITDLDRSSSGERFMVALNCGDRRFVEPVLPGREHAEKPMQGERKVVYQPELNMPIPG